MSLKKYLKSSFDDLKEYSGQVVVEYFVLFAIIAALTIFVGAAFLSHAQKDTERLTNSAVEKMAPCENDSTC